mmetsp:Transcript_24080/g.51760  ORF Transcript_24080/g.51760 Transcript_24080/m.51760 type:complete len:357 (-) Transcript_24080:49-1119(-)
MICGSLLVDCLEVLSLEAALALTSSIEPCLDGGVSMGVRSCSTILCEYATGVTPAGQMDCRSTPRDSCRSAVSASAISLFDFSNCSLTSPTSSSNWSLLSWWASVSTSNSSSRCATRARSASFSPISVSSLSRVLLKSSAVFSYSTLNSLNSLTSSAVRSSCSWYLTPRPASSFSALALWVISCSSCFVYSCSVMRRRSSVSARASLRRLSLSSVSLRVPSRRFTSLTNSSSLMRHFSMRSASTSLLFFWYNLRLSCASCSSRVSFSCDRFHDDSFASVSFWNLSKVLLASAVSCSAFSHRCRCASASVLASMIWFLNPRSILASSTLRSVELRFRKLRSRFIRSRSSLHVSSSSL